jgi:nitroimidazol reductase NimA-like FMN-containing flavoprotein (pyridoxamine 5'-phosphate oxidase superfamily)
MTMEQGTVASSSVVRELSDSACRELLASREVGRLGFVDEGYPIVLPVSYRYVDGRIWIRTGSGSKLSSAPLSPVSFEIDELDLASRSGWSVLAKGVARWATAADGPEPQFAAAWLPGPLPARLVVKVNQLSGRRFHRG